MQPGAGGNLFIEKKYMRNDFTSKVLLDGHTDSCTDRLGYRMSRHKENKAYPGPKHFLLKILLINWLCSVVDVLQ